MMWVDNQRVKQSTFIAFVLKMTGKFQKNRTRILEIHQQLHL